MAQLGARQNGILEVTGSIPVGSTFDVSLSLPWKQRKLPDLQGFRGITAGGPLSQVISDHLSDIPSSVLVIKMQSDLADFSSCAADISSKSPI